MRISDWSSDVCSSDLTLVIRIRDKAVIISPCALDMGAKQVKQRVAVHEPVKLRHPVHRGCTPGDGVGLLIVHHLEPMHDRRSAERRVGNECVSTCISRWSPYHQKKKIQSTTNL